MVKLTREQSVSLERVFNRNIIYTVDGMHRAISYREFRRTVQPGCNCIMVFWAGMWLGIETDGYVHS